MKLFLQDLHNRKLVVACWFGEYDDQWVTLPSVIALINSLVPKSSKYHPLPNDKKNGLITSTSTIRWPVITDLVKELLPKKGYVWKKKEFLKLVHYSATAQLLHPGLGLTPSNPKMGSSVPLSTTQFKTKSSPTLPPPPLVDPASHSYAEVARNSGKATLISNGEVDIDPGTLSAIIGGNFTLPWERTSKQESRLPLERSRPSMEFQENALPPTWNFDFQILQQHIQQLQQQAQQSQPQGQNQGQSSFDQDHTN